MKLNKTRFSAWLVLVALPAFAAKVETVKIPSGAMEKEIPATVILPDAYATNSAQHFPVLYLLHGAGDNHQGWVSRVPAIKDEADRRQFIIVCPDAELSWYYDSPVNPKIKYGTFCSTELVQWADSQYPTITNRQARATCGLSMGGHGALWLAIRHRDTFGTAVALSGGVDVRPFNDWNLPGLLGSKTEQRENWETHAVVSLVPTLKNGDLAISLDCGAGDFFLAVNRDLHQRLLTAKIDHDYSERPGDHNWDYWTKTFPYAAQFIGTQFKRIKAELNLIPATPTSPAPKPGDADCPQPSPSARHTEKVAAVQSGDYDLVLIGDSITHTLDNFGGKYDALNGVWNKHYAPRHAINLGHNGYRTEQVLWNLQNGELDFKKSPKVFVILLGTNNADSRNFPRAHTGLEIFNGIRAIVELIKERHPTSKILLLRPFPKGLDTQRHEATSPPVFSFSQSDVEAARQAGELISRLADDKQVFWLDVNHVFLRPDGTINVDVMWDLLHPNAAGAEAWAQAIEPTLARLMGDLPIVDPQTNSAVVPVSKLENDSYDWFARHAEVLRIMNTINPEVVLIGDSITHFWGGEPKANYVNGPKSWQIPDIESRLWLGSHAKRPLATRPRRTRQPASSHHRPPHWHEQRQRHRQRPAEHARRNRRRHPANHYPHPLEGAGSEHHPHGRLPARPETRRDAPRADCRDQQAHCGVRQDSRCQLPRHRPEVASARRHDLRASHGGLLSSDRRRLPNLERRAHSAS